MADKKYLDFTGLSHYDKKIKALIKDSDTATLNSAKAYTDEKIGDLGTGLDTVASAILAEKTLRENADKAINNVIGVAGVEEVAHEATQEEVDAGKAATVGEKIVDTEAVEATGLQKRLESLEAAVGEGGGVSDQIDAKIEALDVDEVGGEGKFIQSIKEEDGKIVAVAADMPDFAMASDLEALEAVVGTAGVEAVEAKDATIADGVTLYDADGNEVSADAIVAGTTYYKDAEKVTEAVAGTDYTEPVEKVEAVDATGLQAKVEALEEKMGDESVAEQIEALDLENTYAAKEYETKVDTLIGDDSDKSVRTIANEELAKQLIPESAKESLDTLQEIAAWIQAHPDDASAMNEAIQALQAQVGTKAVAGVDAVEAKDATITEGVTLYDGEGNEVAADAIVAGTTYYTDAEHTAEAVKGTDYTEPVEAVEAVEAVAATGLEKEIADLDASTDSRLDALEIAAGLKGDDADKTVAERVKDIENALNSAETLVAITDDEIDGLFTSTVTTSTT